MHRLEAVQALAKLVTDQDLFVCAHGGLRNDWWNNRPGGVDNTCFLTGMDTVSATAFGLAVALPHRRVVSLDTDGSQLMSASLLGTLGNELPPNLTIIVFDNGRYESIGGLKTHTSARTDLAKMAEAAGCPHAMTVRDVDSFGRAAERLLNDNEYGYLVAKTEPKAAHQWPNDKQKTTDGVEEKYRFLRHVERLEGVRIHHVVEIGG
ncbi:MAG: thiamine pyrophosphate-binding protein [Tardiphaga sp.]|jgi:sulfopyruvate decarboxylase subunit beta|nr:thiamine pyrophosphate-binding protein [Tardiphaga sp.]